MDVPRQLTLSRAQVFASEYRSERAPSGVACLERLGYQSGDRITNFATALYDVGLPPNGGRKRPHVTIGHHGPAGVEAIGSVSVTKDGHGVACTGSGFRCDARFTGKGVRVDCSCTGARRGVICPHHMGALFFLVGTDGVRPEEIRDDLHQQAISCAETHRRIASWSGPPDRVLTLALLAANDAAYLALRDVARFVFVGSLQAPSAPAPTYRSRTMAEIISVR